MNDFIKKFETVIQPEYKINKLFEDDYKELFNLHEEFINFLDPYNNIKESLIKFDQDLMVIFLKNLPDDFHILFLGNIGRLELRKVNQELENFITKYAPILRDNIKIKHNNIKQNIHSDIDSTYPSEVRLQACREYMRNHYPN